MLRNDSNDSRENESYKKRQAALQTKGQKRWKPKGSELNAIMRAYSRQISDDTLGEEETDFYSYQ
jgi:hypothetical protein